MSGSVKTVCLMVFNSRVVPRSNGSRGVHEGRKAEGGGEPWTGNSGGVTGLSCGYRDLIPVGVTQSKESTI